MSVVVAERGDELSVQLALCCPWPCGAKGRAATIQVESHGRAARICLAPTQKRLALHTRPPGPLASLCQKFMKNRANQEEGEKVRGRSEWVSVMGERAMGATTWRDREKDWRGKEGRQLRGESEPVWMMMWCFSLCLLCVCLCEGSPKAPEEPGGPWWDSGTEQVQSFLWV